MSAHSQDSSIFLQRIAGVMFMRVNSKCAHRSYCKPSQVVPGRRRARNWSFGSRCIRGERHKRGRHGTSALRDRRSRLVFRKPVRRVVEYLGFRDRSIRVSRVPKTGVCGTYIGLRISASISNGCEANHQSHPTATPLRCAITGEAEGTHDR